MLTELKSRLGELHAREVAAFQNHFDAQLTRAYTWDLWAAAYIIHGGCSDDGFEYFRRWLVSKGKHTFENAIQDADTLANQPDGAAVHGVFEFEEYYYVAVEVYREKTGKDVRENESGDREFRDLNAGPKGTPFNEDDDHLAKRLPRLWKRFGHKPLG